MRTDACQHAIVLRVDSNYLPVVNVSDNLQCTGFGMVLDDVVHHPSDEVVFECSFNHLVEEVGGHELVDVSAREAMREWLWIVKCDKSNPKNQFFAIASTNRQHTMMSSRTPNLSQRILELKHCMSTPVFSRVRREALGSSRSFGWAMHLEIHQRDES